MPMSAFSAACLVYVMAAHEVERLRLMAPSAGTDFNLEYHICKEQLKAAETGKIIVTEALKHGNQPRLDRS